MVIGQEFKVQMVARFVQQDGAALYQV